MVLVVTVSAQEVVDTAQFVAVYDYECRTQNDEGTPVTDKMQVVVQVGRLLTKSMRVILAAFAKAASVRSVSPM